MRRRQALALTAGMLTMAHARADASGPALASYYERHMALEGNVAWGWTGRGAPRRLREGVVQVGVGKSRWFALLQDGTLVAWDDAPEATLPLMRGVAGFAAGDSGWFAIDRDAVLWYGSAGRVGAPQRIAEGVTAAAIGDSADYYVTRDGRLFVKGLAHRGQYGDGRLAESPVFVATASEIVAVKAHTGHAIALRRDGVVMGTGGNRYGPLSTHGLGDKADRWGRIFDGATAIATGSRHSAAIRDDGSLWAWGAGFEIAPRKLMERVAAVAAGDEATIARSADGTLWQWDGGSGPRRIELR
jgi:Regulator of chromosome condensation (RCC1) repeat